MSEPTESEVRMIAALQWAKQAIENDDGLNDSVTRRQEVQKHLAAIEEIYDTFFKPWPDGAPPEPSKEAMNAALRMFNRFYGEAPWIGEALRAAYAVDFGRVSRSRGGPPSER